MQSSACIRRCAAATALALLMASAPAVSTLAKAPDTDHRQAITLDATERAFVLAEMRGFLESVEGIVSALAADRVADARKPAKQSGMASCTPFRRPCARSCRWSS